jgi:hypothetical protein
MPLPLHWKIGSAQAKLQRLPRQSWLPLAVPANKMESIRITSRYQSDA